MRRLKSWGPWVLLVAIAAVALALGLHKSSSPTLDARVNQIASQIRCPVCNGESAAQSQSAPSIQIRNEIRTELQQGVPPNQIIARFVASYGSGILEKPQTKGIGLIVWVLPVVAVVVAAGGLVIFFGRRRRQMSDVDDDDTVSLEAGSSLEARSSLESESSLEAEPVLEPAAVPENPTGGSQDPVPEGAVQAGQSSGGDPRWGVRKWLVAGVTTAVVAALGSWAVVHEATTRLPGEAASGQSLSADVVLGDLQKARADVSKGDVLDAVKSYEAVLAADPGQINATTELGWVLAQTGQPTLLKQGLQLLTSAETSNPSFADAHLYRGLALMSEDDYNDAIPELRWYLAHKPDPQLAPSVKSTLQRAEASAKSAGGATPTTAPSPTTAPA